ncbi:Asp_protease_2 domain-containing protein [Cephalotus follicularis]|uniref:Asp_protease_2 domain-containing protein n=1 Tax=Cephalotus follicularis TaxID=3775 RepID=A0A1Q3B9I9_CEPFO|nr:Asp_protease_2 domain-containing protein [Cephalotus follicularis]
MTEMFKQVQINLPLLDAIRQVPAYAKFLKDLCTTKRKLKTHIPKMVHLTEQVSAVLSNKFPPKLKDPGAPLISCKIGNLQIERALLDLGASVNIIPSSVYDHFGFGELKPAEVTLQLADRSLKTSKGFIEDVLVKVDELYFPVNFLVLDMETPAIGKPHSIILGRPFLATANACINCQSRAMDISFGNKKLRINIFNAPIGPQGEEACFSIDRIDRTYPWSFIDDDCEANSDTVEINALLDSPLMYSTLDRIDTQWLENEAELAWLENKLNEPTLSSEWDHLSHYTHKIATTDQTSFDIEFDSNFIECLKKIEDEEAIQQEFLKWLDIGVMESISDRERKFDEIISECMREFEEIEKGDFFEVLGSQPLEFRCTDRFVQAS